MNLRQKFHKNSVKALDILITNLNKHYEMVNEIMDKTNYKTWTKVQDEHYTGVFYYNLHKTVEETIKEMKEVQNSIRYLYCIIHLVQLVLVQIR